LLLKALEADYFAMFALKPILVQVLKDGNEGYGKDGT
jgi:hypothetical protein